MVQIIDEDIGQYQTTVALHLLPAFSWILDIKPLAITLFNPGSTTIFQATLLHPTFSQLENKNPVGGGVKNVTRQCTLYLPLSLSSFT